MKTPELHISLDREDFVHLVRGGELVKGSVHIGLQDIGLGVMSEELQEMIRYRGSARLGKEKIVGKEYEEKP